MIKKNYNPCIYEGELIQGAEYINGQYKYRYMMEGYDYTRWKNIEDDGWGVMLVNRTSTADIDTRMCTSINGKPIVSMAYLFNNARATSIDMSSFDTSNVTNMSWMFASIPATSINLNNFNTSNVNSMYRMFYESNIETLDLSNFDILDECNIGEMFYKSSIQSGYGKDINSVNKLNSSSRKPTSLTFTVK